MAFVAFVPHHISSKNIIQLIFFSLLLLSCRFCFIFLSIYASEEKTSLWEKSHFFFLLIRWEAENSTCDKLSVVNFVKFMLLKRRPHIFILFFFPLQFTINIIYSWPFNLFIFNTFSHRTNLLTKRKLRRFTREIDWVIEHLPNGNGVMS